MSDIPRKIKNLRIQNKLTQQQLAKSLNVSQNAVYNWENGKREPNSDTIEKIADIFGVTPSDLMGWNKTDDLLMKYAEDLKTNDSTEFGKIVKSLESYNSASEKKIQTVCNFFDQLNSSGQDKVIDYAEDLTKIPEYQKEPKE